MNAALSNPQKISCIIFENLFGPYFLPHQSHSYDYAPSSGENLTSKMSFKSDATYYFHITKPCKITNSGANSVSLTDIDSLRRSVAGRKVSELVKRHAHGFRWKGKDKTTSHHTNRNSQKKDNRRCLKTISSLPLCESPTLH